MVSISLQFGGRRRVRRAIDEFTLGLGAVGDFIPACVI